MLKSILCSLFLLVVSFGSHAANTVIFNNGGWVVSKFVDDMDDSKVCMVSPKGNSGLAMFPYHSKSGVHSIVSIASNIDGVGIKYRVDKKPAVQIGYEYEFQTEKDIYIIYEDETKQMVSNFMDGNNLVYTITSSNQFVDNIQRKVSLSGFSKAWKIGTECK